MKANRGLTVARMVELGGVSRASFYPSGQSIRSIEEAGYDGPSLCGTTTWFGC